MSSNRPHLWSLQRLGLLAWTVFAWIVVAVTPVGATSYVLMSDGDLVDEAPTVVTARVLSRDVSPVAGTPATDYLVEVEQVLKGAVSGTTVVVRVPGGIGPDGDGLIIYGAPQLVEDESAVLFLSPSPDGTYRIQQMMMGVYHAVEVEGTQVLLRDFGEAVEVDRQALRIGDPNAPPPSKAPRDLERFAAWIADRAQGNEREADYFVTLPPAVHEQLQERFTLIRGPDDDPARWFDFENGQPVEFRRAPGGQAGLTAQQLDNALRSGLNAWSSVSNADIRYRLGSPTSRTGGLTRSDGHNTFLFDDPNDNSSMPGSFNCGKGGVLAVGGPWIQGKGLFQNKLHYRIVEADIITNQGISCIFTRRPDLAVSTAAELFGHELGHTLGIDHSSERETEPSEILSSALMYYLLKSDGRGAALNSDDIAAARALYRGQNVTPPPAPAAPSNLTAQPLDGTTVRLTWRDNSNNETRFVVQARPEGGSFSPVGGNVPANATGLDITGLQPGTLYTFRVQAFNGSTGSGFSNQATTTTPGASPAQPAGLVASPVSLTQIRLTWQDRAANEAGFVLQLRSPEQDWQVVATLPADTQSFNVGGLTAETPYTFRVRAFNDSGDSPWSAEASATTRGATGTCRQDSRTLCLLDDRFEVRVEWRDQINGGNGVGLATAVPGSDLSGLFTFFGQGNVELIVKMLDGRTLNDFFWSFYGALSTVEYWITIRDTASDDQLTYHNPPDELCGLADVTSFPREEPLPEPATAAPRWNNLHIPARPAATAPLHLDALEHGVTGTCVPGPNVLCLLENRFRVEVSWDNPREPFNSGVGTVAPVATVASDETGFFWFFTSDNIELVVKILDARPVNGNFWLFYGALSDVEYEIVVTDTVAGATKTYRNEAFNLCGGADVSAF